MPDEYERLILEELTGRGFVLAPRAAFDLAPMDRVFYLWLLLSADKRGITRYARLAAIDQTGMTLQQVRSAEKHLVDQGWIACTPSQHTDNTPCMVATILYYREIQSLATYAQHQFNTGSTRINKECTTVHVQPELSQQERRHLRCPFCVEGITPAGWPCGYCLPEQHAEWLKLDEAGRRDYEERLCDETRARMKAEAAGGGVSA